MSVCNAKFFQRHIFTYQCDIGTSSDRESLSVVRHTTNITHCPVSTLISLATIVMLSVNFIGSAKWKPDTGIEEVIKRFKASPMLRWWIMKRCGGRISELLTLSVVVYVSRCLLAWPSFQQVLGCVNCN